MFKHQINTAYRDITVGNHVYYARYLEFLEIARTEAFRSLGHSLLTLQEKEGIIFPVVECHLHYHSAARYDDLLEIETSVSDLRKVQFTLAYRIFRQQTLILTAMTRHAVTNLAEKPIRIPLPLYTILEKHLTPLSHQS